MSPPRVLFWDIDGTLLSTRRAGVFALEEAALEVCGSRLDLAGLPTAGRTDHEIAVQVLQEAGMPASPAQASDFLRAYERHLPERLGWLAGGTLSGVVEVLDDFAGRDDVVSLLLTGNTEAGAAAKLAHYGLAGYFAGGAFCADGEDRAAIGRRALENAAKHVEGPIDPEGVFVIGDTPADIRVGKAIGARTVAIASGPYELSELEAHDPWLALEALPEPARFAELLRLTG
jgi:phosphoglycolate phosphatase-like HAD superfamily hydrolase